MTDRQLWLFPQIDLRSYIKRYPFVFLLSLASGLSTLLNTLFHLLMVKYVDIPIPGFDSIVLCLVMGVPLSAFLHLILESPRLKSVKYPAVVFSLGLVLLFLLLQFFLNHASIDLSSFNDHLYLFLILACLCLPLLENAGNLERQWAYASCLAMNAAGALMFSWVASFFFRIVVDHVSLPYFNYFLQENGFDNSMNDTSVMSLVFPWYGMGVLSKFTRAREKGSEPALGIGPLFLYSTMVLALLGLFVDWMTMAVSAANHKWIGDDYLYGITFTLFLAWFSCLLLIPSRLQKLPAWTRHYQQIVSWSSFPVILFGVFVLVKGSGYGYWTGYTFFYALLWFAWVFAWQLAKPKAGLAAQAFGLLLLMGLSLAGPLSVRELSFRHTRNHLAGLFKDAGMFKDGKVAPPAAPLPTDVYNKVEADLSTLEQQFGLSRLQNWFSLDLRGFENEAAENGRGYGGQNAQRLLQALGVTECDVLMANQEPKQFGAKRLPLDVKGYDVEERFYLSNTCPVATKENRDHFLVGLSGQNELLMVQLNGQYLVDIPLGKVEQVLKGHDYSEIFQRDIPQEDLSVEAESPKVKAKVYFETVTAFKNGDNYKVSGGSAVLLIKWK